MIQTMFLGRVDYERRERKGQLPDGRGETGRRGAGDAGARPRRARRRRLRRHGRGGAGARARALPGHWIAGDDARAARARATLARIGEAVRPLAEGRSAEALRVADYAAVRQAGYPA